MNAPARPVETVTPYRFTYDDVLRMVEAGILAPNARVELIEGELIEVSPESLPHVRCRRWPTQFFTRRLAEGQWEINPDAPAILEPGSAPEPDVAIFPSAVHDRDLKGFDVVLAIEVSASSPSFDLGRKAAPYARHGVREWSTSMANGSSSIASRRPPAMARFWRSTSPARSPPWPSPKLVVRVADLPAVDCR